MRRGGPYRRRRLVAVAVVALVAAGVVALLQGGGEGSNPVPEGSARGAGERARAARETSLTGAIASVLERFAPDATDAPISGPLVPRSLRDLATRLPRSRQVAQLFLVGFEGRGVNAPFLRRLRRRDWGGVVLHASNYRGPQQLASLTGRVSRAARRARHVPPFVAAPQEGGDGSAFPDLAPPAPPELAAAGARSARRTLRATAGQLRVLGMSMVLAPSADVTVSAGALAGRSFGDDPAAVARLAVAAVEGWRSGGVVPVVGHFPGQGAASQDPLEGPATVGLSRGELERRDLVPFRAVARRAEAIQVSSAVYAAFDGVTPAVLQRGVVRGLLRDRLRFTGVVVTDDLVGVAAATGEGTAAAAVGALQAGADLLYVRDERAAEAAYRAVLGALRRGEVSGARVRESVLRVLRLKRSAGLIVRGRRR